MLDNIYKIPMDMINALGYGKFLPDQCYRNSELAYRLTAMYAKYRDNILGYLATASDECTYPVNAEFREAQLLQTIYMQCAYCRDITQFSNSRGRMVTYASTQKILPGISREALIKAANGNGCYAHVVHDLLGACVTDVGIHRVLAGLEYEEMNMYGKGTNCLQPTFEMMREYASGSRSWTLQSLRYDYAETLQSMCKNYVNSVLDGVPELG